jgi:hypothetical protein
LTRYLLRVEGKGTRGEGVSVSSSEEPAVVGDPAALRALEVFKVLTNDATGRRAFKQDPEGAFEDRKTKPDVDARLADASYGDLPERLRTVLQRLSHSELALLNDLDAALVDAGLYVRVLPDDGDPPGSLGIH